MLKPWWEQWEPSRLDYELDELRSAGIPYELDQEAFSRGKVVLHVSPTVDGEKVDLVVRYPDLYPHFRFQIEAPGLDLGRHQHPFSKSLCLIGRATEHWDSDDTVAKYIAERLPLVLRAARSLDPVEVAGLEQHQGEPFSDYYAYLKDAMVLVDSSWKIDPSATAGELFLAIEQQADLVLRGAVVKVTDETGRTVAEADPSLSLLHRPSQRFRWVRVSAPLTQNDPVTFLAALTAEHPSLQPPRYKPINGGRIDVIGVLFPEEVRWRESADGWLFVVLVQKKHKRGYSKEGVYFARAGRAGRQDLLARVPELWPLTTRTVLQVGLGGIGGPSAVEWARSGLGKLKIVDYDHVDPGTTARWPLGVKQAGLTKTHSLRDFINVNWPYTAVSEYYHRIGNISDSGESEIEALDKLLESVDIIYDASAEVGVHLLLSALAAERKIPYLLAWTTPGAWGGLVARIVPGKTEGCWKCLQWARVDGTISNPPADLAGDVQPTGCADPTFTGTSFDIQQIALGAIRLAVATLAGGEAKAYPDFDWDVAVVSLRTSDGQVIAPRWDTYPLHKHPSCTCENKKG